MRLEYRSNNAYDTILLVAEDVRSAWTVTPDVVANFLADGDPVGWDDQGGTGLDPAEYGDLLAVRHADGLSANYDSGRFATRLQHHGFDPVTHRAG